MTARKKKAVETVELPAGRCAPDDGFPCCGANDADLTPEVAPDVAAPLPVEVVASIEWAGGEKTRVKSLGLDNDADLDELQELVDVARDILASREQESPDETWTDRVSDAELLEDLDLIRRELDRRGIYGPAGQLKKSEPFEIKGEPDRAARIAEVAEKLGSTSVLIQAEGIVNGARASAYGHPTPNHAKIARLWQAYLANLCEIQNISVEPELSPADAAQMMILLKMARLQYSPFHYDSMVDIAGYTACLERMGELDKGEVQ